VLSADFQTVIYKESRDGLATRRNRCHHVQSLLFTTSTRSSSRRPTSIASSPTKRTALSVATPRRVRTTSSATSWAHRPRAITSAVRQLKRDPRPRRGRRRLLLDTTGLGCENSQPTFVTPARWREGGIPDQSDVCDARTESPHSTVRRGLHRLGHR